MIFKPVDEISLRHVFSSSYAKEVLDLSYVGPVLGKAGTIESSPDAMILDMRGHPFKALRCEFKYIPSGPKEFEHNGRFDIAIVWSLPAGHSKDKLSDELFSQNGCTELIVLQDRKAFRDLPDYTEDAVDSLSKLRGAEIVTKIAIRMKFPSVFALCIAAQLSPEKFRIDRMKQALARRCPSFTTMQPKGQGNVVGAFLQTKPPLLELMHGQFYRWKKGIDSYFAAAELTQLINAYSGGSGPLIPVGSGPPLR